MEFVQPAWYFVLVIFVVFVFCFWYLYKLLQFYVWKLPPGPFGLPLFGYVPFIAGKEVHEEFIRLSKKYGSLLSISLGSYRAVVVSDFEDAKQLLSHPAALARPAKFFDVLPEKGGFVGMKGSMWQEQRKFCMHTLYKLERGSNIWEKTILDDAAEFAEYLEKLGGRPTDVTYPLSRSIRSNTMGLLLGRRFTEKETNPDVEVIEKAFRVVTELFQTTNPASLIPWLLKYLVKFNIAGYAEKMKALDELNDMLRREIEKHQDFDDNSDSKDFIGHYLEILHKKNATGGDQSYTVENLIGNIAALFFGGSNSTVATIQWFIVLMAAFPEVQEKVQNELDSIVGKHEHVRWEDRKRLPYTVATILETQRWASVVPFYLPRCASETFESHSYTIPKNTMILTNGWAIHQDPKYWENPRKYMPERFLQTAEKQGKDPMRMDGFAPFSFGKRNCPGETLAIMTLFLYFTGLIQKFTIKVLPGRQPDISSRFHSVIYPKGQDLCFIRR